MPGQRAHTKGKPHNRKATPGSICQAGGMVYANKREAEAASPLGQAERCGRCRQWHSKVKKGRRHR